MQMPSNVFSQWVSDPLRTLLERRKFLTLLFVVLLCELGIMTVAMGIGRAGGLGLFLLMMWGVGAVLLVINSVAGTWVGIHCRSWVLTLFGLLSVLVVFSIFGDLATM